MNHLQKTQNQFFTTKILWFLLFFCLVACGDKPAPKAGEAAPEFSLVGTDGKTYALSDFRGKLVMLDFWTDNCDICKKEFPLVQQYYQKLKAENFEILAIYMGDSEQAAREFQQTHRLTFPVLLGGQSIGLEQYNVRATPTNYLVNAEGKIVRRIVGFVDERQISALLYNRKMNQ